MGYTTEFFGSVEIKPSLNDAEIAYLRAFAKTRRMNRDRGPYFVAGGGHRGQDHDPDVRDSNAPPPGQPGLWCQWVPNEAGTALEWDGGEKFYEAEQWMAYLIEHFLKPGALASRGEDAQFEGFSFDHVLDGEIDAIGEDPDDRWLLRVAANEVFVLEGRLLYADPVRIAAH
jgi:hypothetical protein